MESRLKEIEPVEKCLSPLRPYCGNQNIALYILFQGERRPICRSCWQEISDSSLEWNGSDEEESEKNEPR